MGSVVGEKVILAADRALGNGPAGAAFRVHPAKKSYCQKAPCGSEGAFVASVPPNMRNPEPVAASTIPVLAEGPPSGLLSVGNWLNGCHPTGVAVRDGTAGLLVDADS